MKQSKFVFVLVDLKFYKQSFKLHQQKNGAKFKSCFLQREMGKKKAPCIFQILIIFIFVIIIKPKIINLDKKNYKDEKETKLLMAK